MSVVVIDSLARGGLGTAPFAITKEADVQSSYLTVADLTARDAIPVWQRLPYMRVYVVSTGLDYRLDSNINTNVWTTISTGAGVYQVLSEKNQPSGYVGLTPAGKIDPSFIDNIYANNSYVVADNTARNALTTLTGDIIVTTSTSKIWVKLNNNPPVNVAGDFAELLFPGNVLSVNAMTGAVSITIANLLSYGTGTADFNAQVALAPSMTSVTATVATHSSQIATNAANITSTQTYAENHLGLATLTSTAKNPTGAQVGYSVIWTGTDYDLALITGGGGGGSMTASNGLNVVGSDIRLGGALTVATTTIAIGSNTLAYTLNGGVLSITGSNAFDYMSIDLSTAATSGLDIFAGIGTFHFGGIAGRAWSLEGNGTMTFLDTRVTPNGVEYAADYSATYTSRSLPDVDYVIAKAKSYTTKQSFPVTGTVAGLGLTANASDPTTSLAAGDIYYQTGIGLRVYSGSSWSTVGAGSGDMILASVQTSTGKKTFTTDATNAGILIGNFAGDPSTPVNGDIWYNTSFGYRVRRSGNTEDIVTTATGTSGRILVSGSAGGLAIGNAAFTYVNATGLTTDTALLTGSTTFNLINTTATTINFGAAAVTALNIGVATVAQTLNIATGATTTGLTKAVNIGTNGATGSTTAINIGTSVAGTGVANITLGSTNAAATLTINNSTIVNGNATMVLYNTTSTNISFAGAATTMTMGGAGTITYGFTTMVAPATFTLFNTVTTNLSFAGAATTMSMGGAGVTLTIGTGTSAQTISTTTTGTLTLFNTNATTINFGAAAATMAIGGPAMALTFGNGTSNQTIRTTTTGTLTMFDTSLITLNIGGGTVTTMTVGYTGTGASTINISNGAVSGNTKTINIGNGSGATSTTTVNIGTSSTGTQVDVNLGTSGITGTVTINQATVVSSAATLTLFNATTTSLTTGAAVTTLTAFANVTSYTVGSTTTSAQTVNMFTSSTAASTYNFATGATAAATTKTVNLGTGGAASSTTNINIGSAQGGTTTLSSPIFTGVATVTFFNSITSNWTSWGAVTTLNWGGNATGAATYTMWSAATTTGNTKTINLGTSGATGSTTVVNIATSLAGTAVGNINIGSTNASATTTINTDTVVGGTAAQNLWNATATTINFAGAATTLNIGASAAMVLNFGGFTTAAEFRFLEPSGSGTNYSGFKAQTQSANITYTLPATAGAANSVLTDVAGNGTLSWTVPSGSGDMILASAQTSTGKKTFSVSGAIAGINVGANATDPTTTLAAGDMYYQTSVGLRVYDGGAWNTVGSGGGGWAVTGTTTLTGNVIITGAFDINLGNDTGARTYGFATGQVATATTQTTNIANGGTTGTGIQTINIGSGIISATGTLNINIGINGSSGAGATQSIFMGSNSTTVNTSIGLYGYGTGSISINTATFNWLPSGSTLTVATTTATTVNFLNTTTTTVNAWGAATTLTIGTATAAATYNFGTGATASGTKTINIGTATTTGGSTTINIATVTSGTPTQAVNIMTGINTGTFSLGGNSFVVTAASVYFISTTNTNCSISLFYNNTTGGLYDAATSITIGNNAVSSSNQNITIVSGTLTTGFTRTVNIGTGGTTVGATTNINLGPASGGGGTVVVGGTGMTVSVLSGTFNATNASSMDIGGSVPVGTNSSYGWATYAASSAVSKTFNIGTNGSSGSSVNINLGSTTAGALGTITMGQSVKLRPGTATVGTAPLYFQTGTALSAAVDGAMEYHTSNLYFTVGTTRIQLTNALLHVATTSSATSLTLDTSATTWAFTGSVATTWTLPPVATNSGRTYMIKNRGTATITLQKDAGDGSVIFDLSLVTSITILPGSAIIITSDGTNWNVM